MLKTMKKNIVSNITPPNCVTDSSSVPMRTFIVGIVVRLLRGLISLNVLNPLTDFIYGIYVSRELTTTMKSSQFQASLRYEPGSMTNPIPMTFRAHSVKKAMLKYISVWLMN